MKNIWKNYGLSLALTVLFVVSWILQTWMGWVEFQAEQHSHQQAAQWFGPEGYIWKWGQATFENWQSEFLQLLTFVILSTFLLHKGSPQSRDGDDEMKAKLEEMDKKLDEQAERVWELLQKKSHLDASQELNSGNGLY